MYKRQVNCLCKEFCVCKVNLFCHIFLVNSKDFFKNKCRFSSIAGAGPVTGPIIAAMFGWLPALLWILVGGVFFGAVQDFGALYASVKNEGKSIGLIIRQYIGRTGEKLFLLFAWLFSILVIAAFADMVAGVFNGYTAQGTTSLPNGATATISLLFIGVAIAFGLFIKRRKPSQGWLLYTSLGQRG